VVREHVTLADLAPTVLDLLGLPAAAIAQGRSLLRAPEPAATPILAEKVVSPAPTPEGPVALKQALISGRWKLIRQPDGRRTLFDLDADPGETLDRAADRPEPLGELTSRLDRLNRAHRRLALRLGSSGVRPDAELADEEIESLRALGYLQ
jgi:arylsulfatase A-like enzyme